MLQAAGHELWSGSRSFLPTGPVELTDAGLVGGVGSTFMRMRKSPSGAGELAFDQDGDRLIALMSVAANRPIAKAEVLPHVAAAAAHWRRGDKALANLRLVFANLPNVSDQTAACRLALAEHLLDNGWSPGGLMIELGLAPPPTAVEKYNPNHVPAGNGRRSGQFDFKSGAIVVVMEGGSPEDEKTFEERELLGETTPEEELAHRHPITPTTGIPVFAAPGPSATVGPGPFAGKSVPAGPSARPSAAQQRQIDAIGFESGCHTCGTKNPGTPGGSL